MSAIATCPRESSLSAILPISAIPLTPSCGHSRSLQSWGMASELEYQCCYCGEAISETDLSALRINLSGIWAGKHGAVQDMFSHSACAAERFGAALHSSVPFDVEAFDRDE